MYYARITFKFFLFLFFTLQCLIYFPLFLTAAAKTNQEKNVKKKKKAKA